MIVLLNVRAIARYSEVTVSKPNRWLAENPIVNVNRNCPMPVIAETFPTSRTTLGLSLRPTMNRRKAIPRFANMASESVVPFIRPRT